MLSYNQIIKLNKEFAEAHMVLKSFGNGEVYKVVKHSQQDWFTYPLMWMEDLPNPVNDKEYTYTFRVYFIQQVPTLKDRESDQLTANYDEAKSDMISCARDLLAFWAKDSDYSDLDLIKNTVITTFEDDWGDLVTGCYVDLKLKQAFKYNKCAIPMTGITPPPSEGCQDANLNINATSYGTIASGGTLNLEVRDTLNTLVGFNDGGTWRVPAGVETPRVYVRPRTTGQTVSYNASGVVVSPDDPNPIRDTAYRIAKKSIVDPYEPSQFGEPMLPRVDKNWRLTQDNVFGHDFLFTGTSGGYYDPDTTLYYDVDGNETTEALAFPNDLVVDHHTGFLWIRNAQGIKDWEDHLTDAYNTTVGGFSEFYVPSQTEMDSLINIGVALGYSGVNPPFDFITSNKVVSDTYLGNLAKNWYVSGLSQRLTALKTNKYRAMYFKPIDPNTDL